MTQPDDLLAQAAGILRTQPEPGWDSIADRVIAAVRATPQRAGWPLAAESPPGQTTPGRIYVSDRVLRSTLVATLRRHYRCVPTAIDFTIDDGDVRGAHLEITGSYGTDLLDLADHIRATTIDTIVELLGAPAREGGPIDITITDVVTGNPLEF